MIVEAPGVSRTAIRKARVFDSRRPNMKPPDGCCRVVFGVAVTCLVGLPFCVAADLREGKWIDLTGEHALDSWREPGGGWYEAGDARPEPGDPKRLRGEPGRGVLINGKSGRTPNLLSKQDFADLDLHLEFLIPKGSNSGVKFQGLYEIQIDDSFGVAQPKANHSGGIYPRAEMLPRYHHLDEGAPPRVNAALPAGAWQTLDVTFHAPRFDTGGTKIKNARIEKAVLNGQVIHENVELKTPTGHAWRRKEIARGPILLQGDHGPVAFRRIRVRELAGGHE
jgi:hypothetical protein